MDDTEQGLASTARPNEIERYTVDMVNAAVNRFAEPKIHCDLHFVLHPETGIEHAIIQVPGLSTEPIMSTREIDGVIGMQRCYIRKPGPKSEEPYTAQEWRSLFNRCVQANREGLLDAIRALLDGRIVEDISAESAGRLEEFLVASRARWAKLCEQLPSDHPARFEHGRYEVAFEIEGVPAAESLAELKSRIDGAGNTRLTGWGPFINMTRQPIAPAPVEGGIEAWIGHHSEQDRDGRHSDFWRIERSALMYEIRSIDEDFTTKANPGTAIDYSIPIWRIGETILFVSRFAREFGGDPNVNMLVRYEGLRGRQLRALFDWSLPEPDGVSHSDTVTLKGSARASQIADNTVEVLYDLLKPFYEIFGFAELSKEIVVHEMDRLRGRR
jgi:hypothetical protein